ncbi:MAG: hypothetical protein GXO29_05675 [Thermotogae bacterium]|nr:hypothetical protein [Thermotogota bacterium]
MRISFEELLSFVVSLRPRRITFNFNSSAIYVEGNFGEDTDVIRLWDRLKLEEGEKVECCGEYYDGTKRKASFYTLGFAVHLKTSLGWYRGTVEAFAILYDVGTVSIIDGRKRRTFRGSFKERGASHLYGWSYAHVPGGGMFYRRVLRATRRFALLPGRFLRLDEPKGFNVLLRLYEEVPGWERSVGGLLLLGGDTLRSRSGETLRVGRYVIKPLDEDLLLIHERRAVFRIIYERLTSKPVPRRRLLMAVDVEEVQPPISKRLEELGFVFRGNTLVEVPSFLRIVNPGTVEEMLSSVSGTENPALLALKVARILAADITFNPEDLVMNLMLCNNPYQDPEGKVIVRRITQEDLEDLLP